MGSGLGKGWQLQQLRCNAEDLQVRGTILKLGIVHVQGMVQASGRQAQARDRRSLADSSRFFATRSQPAQLVSRQQCAALGWGAGAALQPAGVAA